MLHILGPMPPSQVYVLLCQVPLYSALKYFWNLNPLISGSSAFCIILFLILNLWLIWLALECGVLISPDVQPPFLYSGELSLKLSANKIWKC